MNLPKKRELMKTVPVETVKLVKKAIRKYGAGFELSRNSGIVYESIRVLVRKRKATQTTLDAIAPFVPGMLDQKQAA